MLAPWRGLARFIVNGALDKRPFFLAAVSWPRCFFSFLPFSLSFKRDLDLSLPAPPRYIATLEPFLTLRSVIIF